MFKTVLLSVNSGFLAQVRVSRFQELRYNVALILKEMNDLEKKSILQIQTWSPLETGLDVVS